MKKVNINCDVGEGIGNEGIIMPFLKSCSIACGGHAGDSNSMRYIVQLAIKNKVKIGAHPSYPDKENFGRKSIEMNLADLKASIFNQIQQLNKIIVQEKGNLHHIKPHGALYNDIVKNSELAHTFLEAISPFKNTVVLFVPFNSEIEKMALKHKYSIVYEVFADRNYNSDLSLVNRNLPNAVITNAAQIKSRIEAIIKLGLVTTINGEKIPIKGETFCVHSDTENAAEIIQNLAQLY